MEENNGFSPIVNNIVQGLIIAWIALVVSMGTLWLIGKLYE